MTVSLALVEGNGATIPEADVKAALLLLAQNAGNVLRTSRELGIDRGTLRKWRETYRASYVDIAERYSEAIDQALIESGRQTALRAMQKAGELVDAVDPDTDPNPSASAQRLATVSGIATDKALLMQGRPTSITSTSSTEEDLRFLRSRAIPDAQVVDVDPESEPS